MIKLNLQLKLPTIALQGIIKTSRLKTLVLTLLSLSLPLQLNDVLAQARLMGAIKEVVEDGQRYEQYTVKCGTVEERKLVRRPMGTELWCDKQFGRFCAEGRVPTAHLVCSPEYFAAMEGTELNPTNSATSGAAVAKSAEQLSLESEKRSIESELLDIEAQKLELRNKELSLLREEAELNSQN